MEIVTRRIYDEGQDEDGTEGHRVLVDRVWPRGVSREDAALDAWKKELAPSDELRRWFDHDPERWGEFRRRYLHELSEKREEARALLEEASGSPLVLLYGARDEEHNQARVLKEYLENLGTAS